MGTKADPGQFDCYQAAGDDEPIFVLRANDWSAPGIVDEWADRRAANLTLQIEAGGVLTDEQVAEKRRKIVEARVCAQEMRAWKLAHGDD